MLMLFSSNLALNYKLLPARALGLDELEDLTMEAISGGNTAILFTLFTAGLYSAGAWLTLKRPKAVVVLLGKQWPLLLFFILILASTLWSTFPDKVLNNVVHYAGTTMVALAAALRYRHDPWLFPKHVGYVLGANMAIQLAAIVIMPEYTIDWENRWHGLAPHPNPFGAMAFTTLWANATALIYRKNEKRTLHFIFAAMAVLAMVGADSVTSMITSIVAIFLLVMIKKLNAQGVGLKFYSSVLVIIFFMAMVISMVGVAFDLSGLFALFGRDTNLTGRTSIWEVALKAITERPWLGWSFNDHADQVRQGLGFLSFHNGYLDLAVSGGLAGIVVLLLMLATWVRDFAKSSRIGNIIAPYSAPFVIGYLIHNITEASLVSPRGQMWQIFMVLAFLGACKRWAGTRPTRAPNTIFSLPTQVLG